MVASMRPVVFGIMAAMICVGCVRQATTTLTGGPTGAAQGAAGSSGPNDGSGSRQAPAAKSGAARVAPGQFAEAAQLGDVHFEFDKYEIGPDQAKVLDATADWLRTESRVLVLVEGHCDERGTAEYNVALGDRRAKATMNYLVAHGVAKTRLSALSYGEQRPACDQHTEQCWAKNRRAHFRVKAD